MRVANYSPGISKRNGPASFRSCTSFSALRKSSTATSSVDLPLSTRWVSEMISLSQARHLVSTCSNFLSGVRCLVPQWRHSYSTPKISSGEMKVRFLMVIVPRIIRQEAGGIKVR